MTHKQEAEQTCKQLEQKYGCDIQIRAYSEDSLDVHISFPNTWKTFDIAIFACHNDITKRLREFFINDVTQELDKIRYEIKPKENE